MCEFAQYILFDTTDRKTHQGNTKKTTQKAIANETNRNTA